MLQLKLRTARLSFKQSRSRCFRRHWTLFTWLNGKRKTVGLVLATIAWKRAWIIFIVYHRCGEFFSLSFFVSRTFFHLYRVPQVRRAFFFELFHFAYIQFHGLPGSMNTETMWHSPSLCRGRSCASRPLLRWRKLSSRWLVNAFDVNTLAANRRNLTADESRALAQ